MRRLLLFSLLLISFSAAGSMPLSDVYLKGNLCVYIQSSFYGASFEQGQILSEYGSKLLEELDFEHNIIIDFTKWSQGQPVQIYKGTKKEENFGAYEGLLLQYKPSKHDIVLRVKGTDLDCKTYLKAIEYLVTHSKSLHKGRDNAQRIASIDFNLMLAEIDDELTRQVLSKPIRINLKENLFLSYHEGKYLFEQNDQEHLTESFRQVITIDSNHFAVLARRTELRLSNHSYDFFDHFWRK